MLDDPGTCSDIIILLQMLLLNCAFALDNAAVLLMAANNLTKKNAIKAILAGVIGAIGLRLVFAIILALAVDIEAFPLSFVGGAILIMLMLKMTGEQQLEKKGKNVLLTVILTIILGDLSMSFDNTIALVVLAKGSVWLLIVGLLSNIPIILILAYVGNKAIKRFPPVIFLASALLAYTGFEMMIADVWVNSYVNLMQYYYVPWIAAALVIVYGVLNTDWNKCWLKLIDTGQKS